MNNLSLKELRKLEELVYEVKDASDFEYQDEDYQLFIVDLHSKLECMISERIN